MLRFPLPKDSDNISRVCRGLKTKEPKREERVGKESEKLPSQTRFGQCQRPELVARGRFMLTLEFFEFAGRAMGGTAASGTMKPTCQPS